LENIQRSYGYAE